MRWTLTFTCIAVTAMVGVGAVISAGAQDQNGKIVLPRESRTIVLEPYGPGIVRITLSTSEPAALSAPGYGIVGTPSMSGWTHSQDSEGYDVIRSGELVVRVAPGNLPAPKHLPLDEINQKLRDIYFPPGNRRGGPSNDTITVATRPANLC